MNQNLKTCPSCGADLEKEREEKKNKLFEKLHGSELKPARRRVKLITGSVIALSFMAAWLLFAEGGPTLPAFRALAPLIGFGSFGFIFGFSVPPGFYKSKKERELWQNFNPPESAGS